MENKPKINKQLFATITLQKFITDYTRGKSIEDVYTRLSSQISKDNAEGKKILENCKALFENPTTQKEINLEITTIRTETNTTKGRNPTDSEIAKWIIRCFSEEIFDVSKRTYDMSKLASKGMISTVKTPQGIIKKQVGYTSFEDQLKRRAKPGQNIQPPKIVLKDRHGNPIHIQFMGCLAYKTFLSSEYIYKFCITQTINGDVKEHEAFSNISISEMKSNKELCDIVVSELLSPQNITLSNADGYIGEISLESSLKTGEEKFDAGFYTYQISQKYALVYNGERIEAIRAYKQQQAMKKAEQVSESDTHKKTDDEMR